MSRVKGQTVKGIKGPDLLIESTPLV
jgi:hypothetical protein